MNILKSIFGTVPEGKEPSTPTLSRETRFTDGAWKKGEIDAIVELIMLGLEFWQPEINWRRVKFLYKRDSLRTFVEDTGYFHVIRADDRPCGIAELRYGSGVREGEVFSVYVLPEFRGRGLSKRLMFGIIDEARRRGLKRIFLEVNNPVAIALYKSIGFQDTTGGEPGHIRMVLDI